MLLDETEMVHGDGIDNGYDDGRSFLDEVDAIHGEIRKLGKSHELNAKKATRSELKFKITVGILLLTWVFVFVSYLGKPYLVCVVVIKSLSSMLVNLFWELCVKLLSHFVSHVGLCELDCV